MPKCIVTSPDGKEFEVSAPDGATQDQVLGYAKAQFSGQKAPDERAAPKPWNPMDLPAGLLRGAGSIGATLLAPIDMAKDALAGKGLSLQSNRERRAGLDGGLQMLGADPDSKTYALGKIGGEIAGTMGAGGALARGTAALAPSMAARAPALLDAISTSGMRANGLSGAAGLGARTAGGALTGGVSAALVNPEDAGLGAGIGAALPSVVSAAGKVGHGVGGMLRGPQASAVRGLADALGGDPAALAQALRSAEELVPGSAPTAAQALRTPQAGILERVVSDSKGGAGLKERYAAQNAARLQALDAVAPTDPRGFRAAQQDTGMAIDSLARKADAAARARTSGLHQSLPQDEAMVYLPDLTPSLDKFYSAGSFVDRGPADKAVQTAQALAAPLQPMLAPGRTPTLAGAVRKAGGVRTSGTDLAGEARALDAKNMIRRDGKTLDDLAEYMHQRGMIPEESPDALIDALRNEAMGGRGGLGERSWQAMNEAAMGEPGARKVTLREFNDLRKSIGIEQRAAGKAGNDTLAASLNAMKGQLDERLNEVVRGDGAVGENLPIAWANALDAARKSKVDQVQRFRTGPQASMFRTGADGQPMVQGGEVASLFWGNRPGLADDVQSLRKLIADDPQVLNQFRSMVTTEGAKTATNAGNLTGKFSRWADNARPGLGAAFEPEQVTAIDRIAQDITRAEQGAAAGMSRGSNTYQNAQNALSLGLLDSRLADFAANRVPLLGNGLDKVREIARDAKAKRLAGLLADPKAAAAALESLNDPALRGLFDPLLLGLHRSAPALAADR